MSPATNHRNRNRIRNRRRTPALRLIAWPAVPLALLLSVVLPLAAAEPVDFNGEVRPILSDKCFFCHGPDQHERKAGLRLDVEANAKEEVIVPGNPEASELVARITASDPDDLMPPPDSGKSLDPAQIELLKRWIREGAKYERYWAYAPPQRHEIPSVKRRNWPVNWTDRFVLSRLEKEGLSPAPDADPITLVRRLYFDLIGLPPAPAQVDRFLADKEPGAYERLVDRLLESAHYGERMAMYWLDLVRYADTVGYHGDQTHSISPYRDYVIESFNENKRFDRFTIEQLAGDLLPDPTLEQKVATGYNRLLQTSHEGGVQEKEYLAIYMADRIRNLSAVWMGATVGCAQCHDHKYDPYTARDFYSLQAFFADVDENAHLNSARRKGLNFNALPSPRPPEILVGSDREVAEFKQLEKRLQQIRAGLKKEKDADKKKELTSEQKDLQRKFNELDRRVRKTMVTVSVEPRTIRLLPRGNWLDDSGPVMKPEIPEFLGRLETGGDRPTRMDLAQWLVDPENGVGGLTARVMANRFWYLFFGVGISKNLDDFGGQGEPPVHPGLLDNLAVEFHESGWDIKHMVKLIVTSRAYRQSSKAPAELRERDPYNRLYARQSRFRLPAEIIRDNALAISGLLVREQGGESVKPYQPAGYYRHLNFPTRTYSHDTGHDQWRRGLYIHWQRQFLHPMLKAMDAPSREECTAERPRSNTPLAALTLLNDPTFVEAARRFAERILREGGKQDDDRLEFAFRQSLSRNPDASELEMLSGLLESNRRHYTEHPDDADALLKTGLAPVDDSLARNELAAWTAVARALLNLNETITRN